MSIQYKAKQGSYCLFDNAIFLQPFKIDDDRSTNDQNCQDQFKRSPAAIRYMLRNPEVEVNDKCKLYKQAEGNNCLQRLS